MRTWPALALLLALACAPRPAVDLVDHAAWTLADPAADPFTATRPAEMVCDPTGFGNEPPVFEVETELCDWGTFVQPLLEDVVAGDLVRMVGWHLPLFSDDGGEGFMTVRLGPLNFEYTVQIPADETVLRPELTAEETIPAGTEVLLHVHNHGANSWRLLELRAGSPEAFAPQDG